jgi:hypothetical protein
MLTGPTIREISYLTGSSFKMPDLIDFTQIDTFRACPTKWLYRFCYNLSPKKGGSIHLSFGSAFAKGLEVSRRQFYIEGKSEEDSLALGIAAALAEFPPEAEFSPKTDSEAKKSPEALTRALTYYLTKAYPLATTPFTPYKGMVEFTFALPLSILHPSTGDPILYGGKPDQIGIYGQDETMIFVSDEKTTGGIGAQWANQWSLRGQFLGYVWAAREHNIPVKGTLVRGVAILAKEIKCAELAILATDWQVERWVEEINHTVKEMIECVEKARFSQAFGSACAEYGGCQYRMLCESQVPTRWIIPEYDQVFWSPLHPKVERKVLQYSTS